MRSAAAAAAIVLASGQATLVHAVDQPISAVKLVVRRASSSEKLVFLSKDPAFLFPLSGGADDPRTGGALVELVSEAEGLVSFQAAGGSGWTAKPGGWIFTNPAAPGGDTSLRVVKMKQGTRVRVVGRAAGLALSGPQGRVALRLTTGSLRSCALFDEATIRHDEAGGFVAKGAIASSLGDCSDASLGIRATTTSTSVSSTSSTTFPSCGVDSCWGLLQLLCCDPDHTCVHGPSTGAPGGCEKFTGPCDDPADCSTPAECVGGACCMPTGSICASPQLDGGNPIACCPGATCLRPEFGAYSECCSLVGQPCFAASQCCSGNCDTGVCDYRPCDESADCPALLAVPELVTDQCIGGQCCTPVNEICFIDPNPLSSGGPTGTCCPGSECSKPFPPFGRKCCRSSGQSCSAGDDCCSASCNAGVSVCDP